MKGVSVRHSGQVIAHTLVGGIVELIPVYLSQEEVDVRGELFIELYQDFGGLHEILMDYLGFIHPLVEEIPQPHHGLQYGGAEGEGEPIPLRGERAVNDILDHGVYPLSMGCAKDFGVLLRDILLSEYPGPDRVIEVMVYIGDDVGHPHHSPLNGSGLLCGVLRDDCPFPLGVLCDPVPYFKREIQSLPLPLQQIHDPQALLGVRESMGGDLIEDLLPCMAEGGVSQVMGQGNGLGEVLIEPQGLGDGPGDLGDFQGVGQPGAIVIAGGGEEDLGLVLEAAEGLGVDDPIPVPLKGGTEITLPFFPRPPLGLAAQLGVGREDLLFYLL